MPRKPTDPPPKATQRDEWCGAFIDELVALRPHLAPGYGSSNIAWALAATWFPSGLDPKTAAQRYHAQSSGKLAP